MTRKWMDMNQPVRKDVEGIEWYATDPYPTWYRRTPTGEIIEAWPEPTWADRPGVRMEPCGAFNPWPGENPPCGRPKGHSKTSKGKGGSWADGHAEKPGDDDPPTKRFERRWVIV